jgi:ribonuclease-3
MTTSPEHLSPRDEQHLDELERRLGVKLRDRSRAICALTHRSYLNEHRELQRDDNERLEFLGDAVLDLAISHHLMERCPAAREGELSRLRAAIVDEEGLARVARGIGLGELLVLGRGEQLSGGRDKPSLLADAMEAVFAVIYLDGGLEPVVELTGRLFRTALEEAVRGEAGRDFKTALQELVQGRFKSLPRYRIVSETGSEHAKTFEVEVEAGGTSFGRGEGRTKKEAEQAAARQALEKLAAAPGQGR